MGSNIQSFQEDVAGVCLREFDMCWGQIPTFSSDIQQESKDYGKRRVSCAPNTRLIGSETIPGVNLQVK